MSRETAKAAEKLANMAETHLSKLKPKERAERLRAFRKVVSRIGVKTSKQRRLLPCP